MIIYDCQSFTIVTFPLYKLFPDDLLLVAITYDDCHSLAIFTFPLYKLFPDDLSLEMIIYDNC